MPKPPSWNDDGTGVSQPEEKFQPARIKKRDSNELGTQLTPFNEGQKITEMGGNYQDFRSSDADGNYSQKDKNLFDLKSRNKEGQEVRHFYATHNDLTVRTNRSGGSAYNGEPIGEVYEPATSHGNAYPEAVVYKSQQVDVSDSDTSNDEKLDRSMKPHEG